MSENKGVHEMHTLAQRSNEITALEFLLSLGYAKQSITQAEQLSQLHGKPCIWCTTKKLSHHPVLSGTGPNREQSAILAISRFQIGK